MAKERHITRLDADMVIIRGQLAEKNALMVDIVRLLDSNILTSFDGVKRQLEVGCLKKQITIPLNIIRHCFGENGDR